jgi:hypothetical protein
MLVANRDLDLAQENVVEYNEPTRPRYKDAASTGSTNEIWVYKARFEVSGYLLDVSEKTFRKHKVLSLANNEQLAFAESTHSFFLK